MLRVDRMGFNRNFFGSQAASPEAHEDQGQRSVPRGGAVDRQDRRQGLWVEMDQSDAARSPFLEYTGVGAALVDRVGALLAGEYGGRAAP